MSYQIWWMDVQSKPLPLIFLLSKAVSCWGSSCERARKWWKGQEQRGNKQGGEEDEMTTVWVGRGAEHWWVLSFEFPATDKQGISYENTDPFCISACLLSLLNQHRKSLGCWLTIELFLLIWFGLIFWCASVAIAVQYLTTASED